MTSSKTNLADCTATELVNLYRTGQASPVEAARAVLVRIAELDPVLNAYCLVDADRALAGAQASEARWQKGAPADILDGVPVSIKDLILTRGWPTLRGSRTTDPKQAWDVDAPVVARLREAGAVLLGKTNTPEFGCKGTTDNTLTGVTYNPWDTRMTPGGSSGGAAAAVASGMGPLAVGTDGAGSVRIPSSFCGIPGLKPSFGRVPAFPLSPFGTVAHLGPHARSVEDLALMLNVMAGFDARDSTSLERPAEDYTRLLDAPPAGDRAKPLSGLRIGVPKEYFGAGLGSDVGAAVEAALAQFENLGAKRVAISLPNSALSVPAYYVIAPAEASSNLSRFDGVRYGYRTPENTDLPDMYRKSRAQGFGAEVKRRILIGTYVLSHGYYDAYYLKAQKIRRLIAQDFVDAYEQCDLIMGPTSPSVAFGLGSMSSDPVQMYLNDIYTVSANLAGLPAMSIPCGLGGGNLPVGLQLAGNYFAEARMLQAAHRYQLATDWHLRQPAGVE